MVSGSCIFLLFILSHLYPPCDVPSMLLRPKLSDFPPKPQNHQPDLADHSEPVNLHRLKLTPKTPALVEFHAIKCLGKEISHSSVYFEIFSLLSSLAKLLVQSWGNKVLLRISLWYPSLPSPSHLNFSRSGLASYSCYPKLLHHFNNRR